jgi:hypothetical protein
VIPRFTFRQALNDENLLGHVFRSPPVGALRRLLGRVGDTWGTWKPFLIASRGEKLTPEEEVIFRRFTGNRPVPLEPVREQVYVIGRRGGKDVGISDQAAYLAGCCDYPELAPGERGVLLVIAADQAQASVQFNYIRAALEGSPLLSQRIVSQTGDTISLDNNVDIQVRATSFRRLRGLTCVGIVCSEVAFWLNENSSNPDEEILRAIRPSLLTTGGPLVMISTPYSKQGELWKAYERHFGKDSSTLVVNGSSRDFNPTLNEAEIARAYEEDPESASAEYGGQFRSDIAAFIDRQSVLACVNNNVREVGHRQGRYFAFCDPSGGRADSMALAIAHEEDGRVVIDVLREFAPPFSPDNAVSECASVMRRYGLREAMGDRYGAEWVTEAFRRHGVEYKNADKSSSELFRELVPLLNTRTVLLLDHQKSIGQLCALERRTGRGADIISHPRNGHDDLAVVIAGAAFLAGVGASKRGQASWGMIGTGGEIYWRGQGGRVSALDADRGGCIPSAGWLRDNDKSKYGSTRVTGLF